MTDEPAGSASALFRIATAPSKRRSSFEEPELALRCDPYT